MGSMETVTSRDGTPIAYERSGDGPPLVVVHGTTADHLRQSASGASRGGGAEEDASQTETSYR